MAGKTNSSLTIVIPALNEEDAIGSTIQRCLDARELIKTRGGVDEVEVIAVSDGSTDKTVEIARSFEEARTIVFPVNRGYGAAIKEGWRQGRGTLVGFLDADGTCDPEYFAEMCHRSLTENADVVLGSRLGPESQMPRVRRLGNRIYAFLLGLLCGRHVTDTASGMRVVQRSALKYLYPLPDGLHFTPSMSARALLNNLRVIEIPMRYEERIGTSKLSVVRDGIRFFKTIFHGVLCYRPERLLLAAFGVCALLMLLLGVSPLEFYLANDRVEEWMIYRFVAASVLGSVGLLLLLSTALANRMALFGPRRNDAGAFWPGVIAALLDGWGLVAGIVVLFAGSLWMLWPGILEYAATRTVTLHWSRLLVGAFGLVAIAQALCFALLLRVLDIWRVNAEQRSADISESSVEPNEVEMVESALIGS